MDIPLPVVCNQSKMYPKRYFPFGMLALLDFDTPYRKEVDGRIGDCNEMQIYDSYMVSYLKLYTFMLPMNGNTVTQFVYNKGVNY